MNTIIFNFDDHDKIELVIKCSILKPLHIFRDYSSTIKRKMADQDPAPLNVEVPIESDLLVGGSSSEAGHTSSSVGLASSSAGPAKAHPRQKR